MAEYAWCTLERARRFPLSQAFALYEAIKARYGVEPTGPTYRDKAMIKALREARDN